jgi:hypothetical protein
MLFTSISIKGILGERYGREMLSCEISGKKKIDFKESSLISRYMFPYNESRGQFFSQ